MSSLRGARIAGKRCCSAATIAAVSSTDKRRLGQEREIVGIGHRRPPVGVLERLDQGHRAGGHLAERADHLGMAGVADEQDVAAVRDQPLGLAVDLATPAGRSRRHRSARAAAPRPGPTWARRGRKRPPAGRRAPRRAHRRRPRPSPPAGRRRSGCGRSRGGHRRARRSARARARRSGSRGRLRRKSRAGPRSGHGGADVRSCCGRRCKASLAGLEGPSYEDRAAAASRTGQPKDVPDVKFRILALLSLTLLAGCRNARRHRRGGLWRLCGAQRLPDRRNSGRHRRHHLVRRRREQRFARDRRDRGDHRPSRDLPGRRAMTWFRPRPSR